MDTAKDDDCSAAGEDMLPGKRRRQRVNTSQESDMEVSQKLKCVRQDSDGEGEVGEQSSNVGGGTHMIFLQYEVVRTILGNLPLQDLRAAAQVCSLWNSVARIILQSRVNFEWFLESSSKKLEENLKTNFYIDPKICILFFRRIAKNFLQCVLDHVGPTCETVRVHSSGIVGNDASSMRTKEIEGHCRLNVSALFMPAFPGVKYTTFELDHSTLKRLSVKNDLTTAELLRLTYLDKVTDLKCMLLFCSDFLEALDSLMVTLLGSQFKRIVVGGAICLHRRDWICGLAVSGEKVVAASMVLPKDIRRKSAAEKYFEKFRKDTRCMDTGQSVCFMFACVGRGEGMYGEPNVESSLFRKYFPSTPLVGFFGLGEIGFDSVLNAPPDTSLLLGDGEKHSRGYLHDYSTVFVYLGFP